MFGLLLVDGMSMLEETTIATIHRQLHGMSIIGGSAGDDLKFENTQVYADGHFISDAAVFTVVETPTFVADAKHLWSEEERGAFCAWISAIHWQER